MFCIKMLLILQKFHGKTLSRSGDMKSFRPGRKIYMYTPHSSRPPPSLPPSPPFVEEALSEERQLMKLINRIGLSSLLKKTIKGCNNAENNLFYSLKTCGL